ncbi:unnamed protein product [Oppiella nova]|uniref:NR LBD domain-containing protein n=1 Tax=Oppiella nova TaxID=334625 RepID=A0A7R9LNN1_9ACAR|nr:unnamed protein product [Oppiella nova]CAG2165432.1 unnamed protein product [Oppiella nova]
MCKTLTDYNGINQLESRRIDELLVATNVFNTELSDNNVEIRDPNEYMLVTNQKYEKIIQTIVDFTKRLDGFQKLCVEDQMSLVKYGCLELNFLRSLLYFDEQTQEYRFPLTDTRTLKVSLEALKEHRMETYYPLKIFMDKFFPEWNRDQVIIDLLSAIVIMNPKRQNLTHKQSIKLEQQLYVYLLQRYLLLRYQSESESKLQKLMVSLTDLTITAEAHKQCEVQEQLQCVSNGKCEINVQTRRLCPKCRLKKCFDIGMRISRQNSVDNSVDDSSNETKLSDETYAQEIEALIGDSLNISDEALSEQIMEIEMMPVFKEITDYNGFNHLESNRISELLSASNDNEKTLCIPVEVMKREKTDIFNKTKPIVDRLLAVWQRDSVIMELVQ